MEGTIFRQCLSGPEAPADPPSADPGKCVLARIPSRTSPAKAARPPWVGLDADNARDGEVGHSDFGVFRRCLSGTGKLADPDCA
jgi:hypothetical protein